MEKTKRKYGRRKEDKLPWFPFWIDKWDTDSDIKAMGPAARGIYLSLLLIQWREGSIPNDVLLLLRMLYMPPDPVRTATKLDNKDDWRVDVESCLEQVLKCFVPNGNGGLINLNLEAIRTEQDSLRIEKSRAGKKGAEKRWQSDSTAITEPCDRISTPIAKNSELESELKSELESKSKAKAASAVVKFQIPDWVPEQPWEDYEEMRRRVRKPMTDRARQLAIDELDRLRRSGNDPTAVLNQSVMNCWQGVFALKDGINGNQTNKQQLRSDHNKQAIIAGVFGGTQQSALPDSRERPRPIKPIPDY